LEVVRELLQNNNVDVNLQKTDGATALYVASQNGHLEVVRELLQNNNVDVNLQKTDGATALHMASQNGHLEVVRELLQNNKVDVNLQTTDGRTALDIARRQKKDDVVLLLEKHNEKEQNRRKDVERKQDMEKRHQQELLNSIPAGSRAEHQMTVDPHENCRPIDDAEIEGDRGKLRHVMKTTSADPVELSLEYIKRFTKNDHKLGSGAFGDVFLAEDNCLKKKFAVKMISPTHCDEVFIKEIRKTFQTELSVSSVLSECALIPFHKR
jgi:general stress protein 26